MYSHTSKAMRCGGVLYAGAALLTILLSAQFNLSFCQPFLAVSKSALGTSRGGLVSFARRLQNAQLVKAKVKQVETPLGS